MLDVAIKLARLRSKIYEKTKIFKNDFSFNEIVGNLVGRGL